MCGTAHSHSHPHCGVSLDLFNLQMDFDDNISYHTFIII
jgi:hypothetical protein